MAVDMLFEMKTLKGPREIKGAFSGEKGFEILGWKWTLRQDKNVLLANPGGANPSKATVGGLQITKAVDEATPQLLELCARGGNTGIDLAGIWCFQTIGSNRHAYYKIKMDNPVVFSVEIGDSASEQDGVTIEKVTLTFSKVVVFSQPWDPIKKNVAPEVTSKPLNILTGHAG